MFPALHNKRPGPIGVDLGSRSVKLVQFNADRTKLLAASKWDLPAGVKNSPEERDELLAKALEQARANKDFKGREAVIGLGARELFVQNIRVAKLSGEALDKVVRQEAASRVPFAAAEAEVRYIEADDVRQGDVVKREVLLLACHRPVLDRALAVIERAGLQPVAVDVEPLALLRCYARQFRRDQDKDQRALYVHIGAHSTAVIVARDEEAMFIKYVDLGGKHLDEAVARHLRMNPPEAASLRRHNGDRRSDQQDPEVAKSVAAAVRPVLDRLANELSMCLRYHSVTFRGQPIARLILGGGEASPQLLEALAPRFELKCELGEPLRSFDSSSAAGRKPQWDVAAGLALRTVA